MQNACGISVFLALCSPRFSRRHVFSLSHPPTPPTQTKCGLSGLEHVAKTFRMETPGSASRGKTARAGGGEGAGGGGGSRGKGKRPLSPRQRGGGGGGGGGAAERGDEEESPTTAATSTRLDGLEGGDRSPTSPYRLGLVCLVCLLTSHVFCGRFLPRRCVLLALD